tara:strand:- start:974 stop:1759 length:786 start_codon:yes stop_codon:yes gene_type:complete
MQSSVKIRWNSLKIEHLLVKSLHFTPEKIKYNALAVFSHGYTTQKESIFNWAQSLSLSGIPCVIFDLPGHLLSSEFEVKKFEDFTSLSHLFFLEALSLHENITKQKINSLIIGGHSLGAFLSLKALKLLNNNQYKNLFAICVGLGLPPEESIHIFKTDFFKNTLSIREQLVSNCLKSENILPWLKMEKEKIKIENKKIYMITGKDDIIAPPKHVERFIEKLKDNTENNIEINYTLLNKLAHYQPEFAAGTIKSIIIKELNK